jgi:hypothetical protein
MPENHTTFMYPFSANLGASTSWNPHGLYRDALTLPLPLPNSKIYVNKRGYERVDFMLLIQNMVKFRDLQRNEEPTRCYLVLFITLMICSTCFGHLYAHHQELTIVYHYSPHGTSPVDVHRGARNMLNKS